MPKIAIDDPETEQPAQYPGEDMIPGPAMELLATLTPRARATTEERW